MEMRMVCPHCGYEFDGTYECDALGWHSSCPECDGSFDVDPPKRKFKCSIIEELVKTVYIDAVDEEEAWEKLHEDYYSGQIVLDGSDYSDCYFGDMTEVKE